MFPEETPFIGKDSHRLKVKEGKKGFCANGNQKKSGVDALLSENRHIYISKYLCNQQSST